MNITRLRDRLFEVEHKLPGHKYCPDTFRKRRYQLCGKSRDTECIINADELAKCVKLALMKQELRHLQIQIETLEKELKIS